MGELDLLALYYFTLFQYHSSCWDWVQPHTVLSGGGFWSGGVCGREQESPDMEREVTVQFTTIEGTATGKIIVLV